MADGIGRILGGGNSYGLNGYVPQRKEQHEEEQVQLPVENREETLVDADKVMRFMENNNLTIAPKAPETFQLSEGVQSRVENAMERFQMIYPIVVDEFGDFLAPKVMNLIMDKLMAIV